MKQIFIFRSFFRKSLMLSVTLVVVFSSFFTASAIGRRQLSCDGNCRILDEDNNPVILRGFGLGNWLLAEGYMWTMSGDYYYDRPRYFEQGIIDLIGETDAEEFWHIYRTNYLSQEDMAHMKGWGCNSIRATFNADVLQPREGQPNNPPYNYDEGGWVYLDSLVKWCAMYEMYLIWDMHGAPGGQSNENICDSDGEGRLWTQPEIYWPRAFDLWKKIAERYIESDWVVGYNLLNEPMITRADPSVTMSTYRQFCVQCTDTIREVDPYGLIIVDGDRWGQEFEGLGPIWDDQVVLSFHCYPPVSWGIDWMPGIVDLMDNYGTPIWHGETGERSEGENTASVNFLEGFDPPIGWNWWTHKKFNNTKNPYNCPMTTGFQTIINWWKSQGSSYNPSAAGKPSAADAKTWLFEQAEQTNSQYCSYVSSWVASLNLDATAPPADPIPVGVIDQINTRNTFSKELAVAHSILKNGTVSFSFTLSHPVSVRISVYSMDGRLERVIEKNCYSPERNAIFWDRKNSHGETMANGIYTYTVTVGENKRISKQIVLVK